MSEINGLNVFGSLTTQNGIKLKFNDIDLNKDGTITENELNAVLDANEIDTVDLSSIDNNNDKTISEDEFAIYEYKMQIQEQLNNFQGKIALDFSGENSQLIPDVITQLKDFTKIFVEENIKDPKRMVEDYKVALPLNYEKIKANVLASKVEDTPVVDNTEPSTEENTVSNEEVVSNLLDEIVSSYMDELADTVNGITPEQIEAGGEALGKRLETIIAEFVANYTGDNLETDLRAYVDQVLNQSEAERMADDYQKYQEIYNSLGSYIDRSDMVKLKAAAKELLSTALAEGVKVVLNGQEITNLDELDKVLGEINNADKLNADVKTLMDSLSDLDLKGLTHNDTILPAATSSDIAIEADDLDLRFLKYDNGDWSYWKDSVQSYAQSLIDRELKQQLLNQIKADLEAKGLPVDSFNDMFEICYNESLNIAMEVSITQDSSYFERYSYNSKELVANFLAEFNIILANAVDIMYQSNKDIDLVDIDVSKILGKTDYRLSYGDRRTVMRYNTAINNGDVISEKSNGKVLAKKANVVLEQFRDTFKIKTFNFCISNGIKFNLEQFNEIFNSTKKATIDSCITVEGKYPNLSATLDPKELVNKFLNDFKTNYENSLLS